MKGNYFYKKTLNYFSIIIFVLVTLVLLFVNYKTDVFLHYITEKAQTQINEGTESTIKQVEKDTLDYINRVYESNQNDIKSIATNQTILHLISENKMEEVNKLINLKAESCLSRRLNLKKSSDKRAYKKIDSYDKGIIFTSDKEIVLNGKTYVLELRDDLKEYFIKNIRKGLLKQGAILSGENPEFKIMKERFKKEKVGKIVVKEGNPYEKYCTYLPIYNEVQEIIGVLAYDVDLTEYRKLSLNLKNGNIDFFMNMKLYISIFSLIFYIISVGVITSILKNIYNPINEVFDIIDDLSKGKFGRKIFFDKKVFKPLVKKINRLSGNLSLISRIKDEFLLKKSYEYKEALDNIVGISQGLINNKMIDVKIREELKIVFESSEQLLNMTKSLNSYYLFEGDDLKLEASINLKRLVDEASTVLNSNLTERKLYINNMVSEKLYVTGDNLKLFILITNLIDNAIKNSVNSEIRVDAAMFGDSIKVRINDKGSGINNDKLQSLKRYFETGEEIDEVGLGFILAQKTVKQHGGIIEIWSKVGSGTQISFLLKEATIASDKNRDRLNELKKEVGIDTIYGKEKIVIFCDNYYNCKVLINYLFNNNYRLIIVEHKEELEELLNKEKINLLIIDLFGEWAQQYKFIKNLKTDFNQIQLSIILINGRKKCEESYNIYELGINDIVDKPLHKADFLVKVKTQLQLSNNFNTSLELQKEREIAENISNIQEELNSTLDIKKIFIILFKKIKTIFDFDSALVLLKKEDKYSIIFQDGYFEKDEKNDKLFKSRYLDPLNESRRILLLNEFKCKKYFGEKTKSALIIPLKVNSNNSIIILKSTTRLFFKNLSKATVDKIFYHSSIAIKNASLYNALEEKNFYLNSLVDMVKSIDKLISVVYKEKDKKTAIYLILLILVNKMKFGYKEAYYFEFDKDQKELYCTNYYYDLKNYTDEKEMKITAKELWTKKIRLKENVGNILLKAYQNNETLYLEELTTEDKELFGKMLKVTVIPVKYSENKFGLIVLESDRKKKNVNEIEKEALRIIIANLGIYLYNKELEEESIRISSSRTLNSFAKAIIHELRTPLVGVKGFATMTKEKYPQEVRIASYMNNIINDSNRVLDLSSQIIDYVEEEGKNYNYIEDDIIIVIDEVLTEFEAEFKLNKFEIIKAKESFITIFDKNRMKNAFRHIIKNSLENMDFSKNNQYLAIIVEKDEKNRKILSFVDNGVGIEEKFIKDIFDPLVSTKLQGTGFGLPIVKSIVEKHRWTIRIESIKNKYTKLSIKTNSSNS